MLGGCATVAVVAALAAFELRTSRLQARWLSRLASNISFSVQPGRSDTIRYPEPGPYDWRLGYARLGGFLERLTGAGYQVTAQARGSPELIRLIDHGLYPIYREKPQAGLHILDRAGREMFRRQYPQRVYVDFDDVPPLVVQTLLFLENRELLDPGTPYRNPAIEWDRLARAGLYHIARQVFPSYPRLGGSTIAVQLEKMRHSPGGMTPSVHDKLRQIASASVRVYSNGARTLDTQRQLVTGYLNSIPLAAVPGYGEVIGLGDGLWAWYGADVERVNRLLHSVGSDGAFSLDPDLAEAYRQVLSLLVAIRRPSDYLLRRPERLTRDTDALLSELQQAGVITSQFAVQVRLATAHPRRRVAVPRVSFVNRKPVTAIRSMLASDLGLDTLYELDRLDLMVTSTLDAAAQQAVTVQLQRLADPLHVVALGLAQDRLLQRGDPSRVVYSLVVYERGEDANLLRVRADNLDQPLDVNDSTKLELGSTAKLRTLVTYLELIASLHAEYAGRSPSSIDRALAAAVDPLTRWALDRLYRAPDVALPELLEAALQRRYSASPRESFATGGGVHAFVNFDSDHDNQILSVREAFRHSVNLVFVRLLRDIVRYYIVRLPDWSPTLFEDRAHPARIRYLERFIDRESLVFLERFWKRHATLSPEEALNRLAGAGPRTLTRLAVIHRSTRPAASLDEFQAFLIRTTGEDIDDVRSKRLYVAFEAARWSLTDRAFLARTHPLELWLVADRAEHPSAMRSDVIARSRDARRASYAWLLRTSRQHAQDRRIRTEMERDAFEEVHRAWQRLGYPFARLVPSYATAIGSSGDNPTGLAELVGIIQNEGLRYPTRQVMALRFGTQTPTETWLVPQAERPVQVVDPAVAAAIRQELIGVVTHGTGRRVAGSMKLADGTTLEVAGKTGTGDNRVVKSRTGSATAAGVLNRTATFAFLFGDRFYGVLTAYVDGSTAEEYRFTSALPLQVFKHLVPTLLPLVTASSDDGRHVTP